MKNKHCDTCKYRFAHLSGECKPLSFAKSSGACFGINRLEQSLQDDTWATAKPLFIYAINDPNCSEIKFAASRNPNVENIVGVIK